MNVADQVVSHFGSIANTARAFEVERQIVHNWKKKGYVPPRYAYAAEELTAGAVTAKEVIEQANMKLQRATRVVREKVQRGA